MANISKIKLPNGSTVNIKDTVARGQIVELTQAQYDALPSTKLTNGVTYFIKDGNPVTSGVISADGVVFNDQRNTTLTQFKYQTEQSFLEERDSIASLNNGLTPKDVAFTIYDGRVEDYETDLAVSTIKRIGRICIVSANVRVLKALSAYQTTFFALQNLADRPSTYFYGTALNVTKAKMSRANISNAGNINVEHNGSVSVGDLIVFSLMWIASN